jgi:hypothetical protein
MLVEGRNGLPQEMTMTDREITRFGVRIGLMIIAGLLIIGYAMEWSLTGQLSQPGYGALVCWVIVFFIHFYGLAKESRRL